jgi:transposase-like protein
MSTESLPESLLEAVTFFADEDRAHDFFVKMRWPEGVRCVHCGSAMVGGLSRSATKSGTLRRLWNCKACKKQFTAKMGTVFNESPLPLSKWLPALWLVVNAKNGISSCELARALKITQKSAWFMGHRIRASIQRGGGIVRADGVFEVDESYIGGLARNMHKDVREKKVHGRGPGSGSHKTAVQGLLRRHEGSHTTVIAKVVLETDGETLKDNVRQYVLKGSEVHTDAHRSYCGLNAEFVHKVIDHAECYAKDGVTTNGLENFWSLLKRTIKGTYVHCAPFHLFRYLDEQTYRFNERKNETGDQGRFMEAVKTTEDRRLTWKKLTGKGEKNES